MSLFDANSSLSSSGTRDYLRSASTNFQSGLKMSECRKKEQEQKLGRDTHISKYI